jgi:cytochrome oxidase Cu insertion factor (SCO1/SenC/PrrC family)
MLKKSAALALAVFLLLTLIPGCATTGSSTEYGSRVGNLAYDFSLQDMNGKTLTLSSLAEQPVMLNFWETT